jgi:salicylate hydroxylase
LHTVLNLTCPSHPMLPYVAQGAANAIEDAGTLVAAFTQTSDIREALEVYQEVRKKRGETIQQSAERTRTNLHLSDGPEQEIRDNAIRDAASGTGHNPDLWADSEFQSFMWGVDAMRDVVERWDELVSRGRRCRI